MAVSQAIETGKFQTAKVAVISGGHSIQDTYQAFLPALLPVLIEKFSLTKTEAGLLSVFTNAPSLLQPLIGYLADRVSLRILVILAPAVTALIMSFLGIAPSYLVAAVLLVVAGLSSASIHAVGPVIAGRLSANRLGMGMSFWMVGGELGRTFGPIIIVSAISYLKPEGSPWLAIGGILTSLILYVHLRNTPDRPSNGPSNIPWRAALKSMRKVLIPVTGIVLTRAFAYVSVSTYLPTFMTERGAGLILAGGSLSVMEAAGVAGAFLGGVISDRLGRRPVLAAALVLTSAFLFIFLNAGGWLLFPILLLLGFTLLSTAPVVMATVQESFPENRALVNGVYMAINFVLSSLVTVLVGRIGDLYSLSTAYTISALLILGGLPFVFMLPKTNGR
jgi:FSR family fosmidomycin resistance protein-like MFS transporter